MKKIISMLLILVLGALMFVSCGGDDQPEEKEYTLAIGVAVAQEGAKVTNTVAAVVADKDGKIVSCRIDCIDVKANLLDDGTVDASTTYQSKAELKDKYNMVQYGGAKAEWYVQAKAVEDFVAGKTQAEVKAIALDATGKTTNADLLASCTIGISDFIKAIDNAFKSEHKVSFKSASALTVGVSVNADVTGKVKGDSVSASYVADFAASVIADGKVAAAVIDSNEVTAPIVDDEFGAITYPGTKLEQGDDYNMVEYAGAKAEWYVQAQTYANTAVGKTASEVATLATEGIAGCTIAVEGYQKALAKAAEYAR